MVLCRKEAAEAERSHAGIETCAWVGAMRCRNLVPEERRLRVSVRPMAIPGILLLWNQGPWRALQLPGLVTRAEIDSDDPVNQACLATLKIDDDSIFV